MREIKFRVWDGKEILDVTVNHSGYTLNELLDGINSNYKLMQYTGLKDKYDVPIWEGDIVKSTPDGIVFYTRVIEYENHGFVLSRMASFLQEREDWSKLEVIGNIYENKELLK